MFSRKVKAVDLPKQIAEDIATYTSEGSKGKKRDAAKEDLDKNLRALRDALYGVGDSKEVSASEVVQEMYAVQFVTVAVTHLHELSFDARKDFKDIFCFFCQHKEESLLFVDSLKKTPQVLFKIVSGCKLDAQTALICCEMLKGLFRHAPMCQVVMSNVDVMGDLFKSMQTDEYAVSSSVFGVLKAILTAHPAVFNNTVKVGSERERIFLERIHTLLGMGSVVHKRKVIELLEDVFANAPDMCKGYTSSAENIRRLLLLADQHVELVPRMAPLLSAALDNRNPDVLAILQATKPALLEALAPAPAAGGGAQQQQQQQQPQGKSEKRSAAVDEVIAKLKAL